MYNSSLHILLVEDDRDDYSSVERSLGKIGVRADGYSLSWEPGLEGAKSLLRKEAIDIILLDLSLPDCVGLSGLSTLRSEFPSIPIVVLTSLDDEEIAAEAIHKGAQDYLIKGCSGEMLLRSIRYSVERFHAYQQIEMEREKARAAALAKSTFLANMSHEIRTPLTAIIGFAESLMDSELTLEQEDSLSTIYRNGEHLLTVINDILDISKMEAGALNVVREEVSLIELLVELERAMKVKASQKSLSLNLEFSPPLPAVIRTDPTRLKQVLYNIVGNAIKFTERGSVTIEVSCSSEDERLFIDVVDTGIGLTEEEQHRLFQAFSQADTSTTREFGGTGLGLVISKQLAERLGGSLTLKSKKGEGSIFTIAVETGPINESQMMQTFLPTASQRLPAIPSAKTPSLLSGRVLLADDCSDTQDLFCLLLAKTEIEVEVVSNGKEAVDKAREREFDLILMDMQMPVMDGYTAVQVLRGDGYEGPIVAFTASVENGTEHRCQEHGCNSVLRKPFKRNDLYSTLEKYLTTVSLKEGEEKELEFLEIAKEGPSFAQVILRFVLNLPQRLSSIQDATEKENWEELKQLGHKLSGTSGNLGCSELGKLGKSLEHAADLKSVEESSHLIKQLREEIQDISEETDTLASLSGTYPAFRE